VTVATVAVLKGLQGTTELDEEEVARAAYDVEYEVQRTRASPTDTSTCTHGRSILVNKVAGENLLWHIEKPGKEWYIHHLDIPEMTFVIGNTRVRGKTPIQVDKVKRHYEKSGYCREVIEEIGGITLEGAKALKKGDITRLGELMDLNHRRLASIGVSHPRLEKLITAVRSRSYGAKLTGAGGGGCMVALTDKPEEVAEAIKRVHGEPMIVTPAKKGVQIVK
jgi:mevalonate kinase